MEVPVANVWQMFSVQRNDRKGRRQKTGKSVLEVIYSGASTEVDDCLARCRLQL